MTQVISPEIYEAVKSGLDLDPTDALYGDLFQAETYVGSRDGQMGIVQLEEGCNFSTLVGPDRTRVDLCLQDLNDPHVTTMRWQLKELETRPDGRKVWGGYVKGFGPDLVYAVRNATIGNPGLYDTPVLDTFAKSIITAQDPEHPEITIPYAVVPPRVEDLPSVVEAPKVNEPERVIYEANIRGLSMQHPDVPEELRGTYLGACHPAVIKHLKELGITSIELLPFQQFITQKDIAKKGLTNYTGYNTAGFFAPHADFASSPDVNAALVESQIMINTFNESGIEVIMDGVYNHTSEGDPLDKDWKGNQREPDPAHSFRLLDDEGYYYRVGPNGGRNISGCGNTLNTANPVVRDMILESLRFWKKKGVAGFRFDLLTALTRDSEGRLDIQNDPLMAAINEDPELKNVVLIGEPWDATECPKRGQVGTGKWYEWNEKSQGEVRDFWLSTDDATRTIGSLAMHLSSSLEPGDDRVINFIKYITTHDGFTLRDLTEYLWKHNVGNGENNEDGANDNHSNNHGVEGLTDDPEIIRRRIKAGRNLLLTLIASQGPIMIRGGDEVWQTQKGSNNAYCQDNKISWIQWDNLYKEQKDILTFFQKAMQIRHSGNFGTPTRDNPPHWLDIWGQYMTDEDWKKEAKVLGMHVPSQLDELNDYLYYANGNREGREGADVTISLPKMTEADVHEYEYIMVANTDTGEINPDGIGMPINDRFVLRAMSSVILKRVRRKQTEDIAGAANAVQTQPTTELALAA